MKKTSIVNFLKKIGAILIVFAIFASSCNKYADDFELLNKKFDTLSKTVDGVLQLVTDISTVKSQITSLQATVATLPTATQQTSQFATVTAQLNSMNTAIASIDTQLKAVANNGTATSATVAKLVTDLDDLKTKITTDNAKIIQNQTDAMIKLNSIDVKITGLDNKMTSMTTTMNSLAIAVAKVQSGVDTNTSNVSTLAVKLTEQATAISKIGADLIANTNADLSAANVAAAAVLADAASNGLVLAGQATILGKIAELNTAMILDAKTGKSDDTAASRTIEGLQIQITAMQIKLDQILANTLKEVTGVTITNTVIQVGAELTTVVTSTVGTATVSYEWSISDTAGNTYVIASANSGKYTILPSDLGMFIKVKVTGTGAYSGVKSSAATTAVLAQTIITGVSINGTSVVGNELTTTVTPIGTTASYLWESAATVSGVYSPIIGASTSTGKYTIDVTQLSRFIRVTVTGINTFTGTMTSVSTPVVI